MGELFCYIFHVTKDWFNVALIKPKPNNIEAPTLEGQTLVAVSFWTLNGVDTMRVNSSHFKFHSGSEGSIFENQQGAYLNNLKKHFNFCLEMIGMLEECG